MTQSPAPKIIAETIHFNCKRHNVRVLDVHANLLNFYALTRATAINATAAFQIKQKMNLITLVILINCGVYITVKTCFLSY